MAVNTSYDWKRRSEPQTFVDVTPADEESFHLFSERNSVHQQDFLQLSSVQFPGWNLIFACFHGDLKDTTVICSPSVSPESTELRSGGTHQPACLFFSLFLQDQKDRADKNFIVLKKTMRGISELFTWQLFMKRQWKTKNFFKECISPTTVRNDLKKTWWAISSNICITYLKSNWVNVRML